MIFILLKENGFSMKNNDFEIENQIKWIREEI